MIFFVVMMAAGLAFYYLVRPDIPAAKADAQLARTPAFGQDQGGLVNREATPDASV
ncbi:MAG TPA: hypothetical protein VIL22_06605 [Paenibacillaceae bacterium]